MREGRSEGGEERGRGGVEIEERSEGRRSEVWEWVGREGRGREGVRRKWREGKEGRVRWEWEGGEGGRSEVGVGGRGVR